MRTDRKIGVLSIFYFLCSILSGFMFIYAGGFNLRGESLYANLYAEAILVFLLCSFGALVVSIVIRSTKPDDEDYKLSSAFKIAAVIFFTFLVVLLLYYIINIFIQDSYIGRWGKSGTFLIVARHSILKAFLVANGVFIAIAMVRFHFTIKNMIILSIITSIVIGGIGFLAKILINKPSESIIFEVGIFIVSFFTVIAVNLKNKGS
ncbi:MAG: hypothetical protein GY714_02665 [Desulfobacterales bacterium]|nr:hypothetical protein [Desulfobacterales bacterium]